jgi:uncharacterized membrane protein YgcG
MPWAMVVGVVAGRMGGSPAPAAPAAPATCPGCGAAYRPGLARCDHCRRIRLGAERAPGYPVELYAQTINALDVAAEIRATSPVSAPASAPDYGNYSAPDYSSSSTSGSDYSSGGGGDFSGGGASGDF